MGCSASSPMHAYASTNDLTVSPLSGTTKRPYVNASFTDDDFLDATCRTGMSNNVPVQTGLSTFRLVDTSSAAMTIVADSASSALPSHVPWLELTDGGSGATVLKVARPTSDTREEPHQGDDGAEEDGFDQMKKTMMLQSPSSEEENLVNQFTSPPLLVRCPENGRMKQNPRGRYSDIRAMSRRKLITAANRKRDVTTVRTSTGELVACLTFQRGGGTSSTSTRRKKAAAPSTTSDANASSPVSTLTYDDDDDDDDDDAAAVASSNDELPLRDDTTTDVPRGGGGAISKTKTATTAATTAAVGSTRGTKKGSSGVRRTQSAGPAAAPGLDDFSKLAALAASTGNTTEEVKVSRRQSGVDRAGYVIHSARPRFIGQTSTFTHEVPMYAWAKVVCRRGGGSGGGGLTSTSTSKLKCAVHLASASADGVFNAQEAYTVTGSGSHAELARVHNRAGGGGVHGGGFHGGGGGGRDAYGGGTGGILKKKISTGLMLVMPDDLKRVSDGGGGSDGDEIEDDGDERAAYSSNGAKAAARRGNLPPVRGGGGGEGEPSTPPRGCDGVLGGGGGGDDDEVDAAPPVTPSPGGDDVVGSRRSGHRHRRAHSWSPAGGGEEKEEVEGDAAAAADAADDDDDDARSVVSRRRFKGESDDRRMVATGGADVAFLFCSYVAALKLRDMHAAAAAEAAKRRMSAF